MFILNLKGKKKHKKNGKTCENRNTNAKQKRKRMYVYAASRIIIHKLSYAQFDELCGMRNQSKCIA